VSGSAIDRGTIVRAWCVFIGVVIALELLMRWQAGWIRGPLSVHTATLTAWMLRVLGYQASSQGIYIDCELYDLTIIGECTAVHPLAYYLAALLAYPTSWRHRLIGLAIGIPAILVINQARLVSLVFVGHWRPELFEIVHALVWQGLIIFLTLLVWIVWATVLAPRRQDDA
jgi:exosortase H (IPTLxxWG-CTERM-specific)